MEVSSLFYFFYAMTDGLLLALYTLVTDRWCCHRHQRLLCLSFEVGTLRFKVVI